MRGAFNKIVASGLVIIDPNDIPSELIDGAITIAFARTHSTDAAEVHDNVTAAFRQLLRKVHDRQVKGVK